MNKREDIMPKRRTRTRAPKRWFSKQPWDVEVDVYLKKGCPDPKFEIHTSLPVDSHGNIIFKNNHRPGYYINFNLYDETGSDPPFAFPPQPKVKEACWSQVGTTCPAAPVWEVFEPLTVSPDGMILRVYNDNPGPAPGLGLFKYALRVTTDGGANYCDIDPGGGDANGSRY